MNINLKAIVILVTIALLGIVTFLPEETRSAIVSEILKWSDMGIFSQSPIGLWFSEAGGSTINPNLFVSNIGHITAFTLLGVVLGLSRGKLIKKLWPLILIAIASSSELMQFTIAGRQPDLDDFMLNIIAGITGYVIYQQFYHSRKKYS